ncbi:MAG: protein translocase subunit SecF [Patescibacteria group bacterium]
MLNIIGNKYIFITIAGLMVAASIASIAIFNFKPGIDFAGGTLWQLKIETADVTSIRQLFTDDLKVKELSIIEEPSTNSFIIRLPELDEKAHSQYLEVINKKFNNKTEELSYETIGPSIGKELRAKSTYAFFAVLLTISLYIAFAFRKVSNPVKSWKYGIVTLVTLFHDALIPLGMLAFLGWWNGLEMNTNFIVAILVVIGFSVHDTIVVFDRIRENLKMNKGGGFANLVNASINETIARSINTSLTLILVLVALLLLGSASLQYFILVILVGTIVGTYSSIFVASPLLVLWSRQ